jgi:hypothetical protein
MLHCCVQGSYKLYGITFDSSGEDVSNLILQIMHESFP